MSLKYRQEYHFLSIHKSFLTLIKKQLLLIKFHKMQPNLIYYDIYLPLF